MNRREKRERLINHIYQVGGASYNTRVEIEGSYAYSTNYGLYNLGMYHIDDDGNIEEMYLENYQVEYELGKRFWENSVSTQLRKVRRYINQFI